MDYTNHLHGACGGLAANALGCQQSFGDHELGRAMRICSGAVSQSAMITTPPPRVPRFRQGWEACTKVWAAWLDSEDARQQREAEAEAERQRQFINDLAARLK